LSQKLDLNVDLICKLDQIKLTIDAVVSLAFI